MRLVQQQAEPAEPVVVTAEAQADRPSSWHWPRRPKRWQDRSSILISAFRGLPIVPFRMIVRENG
jgi:hypothetical protein